MSRYSALHLCHADCRKEAPVPKRLDTSYHKRMLASRMENPEFRAEYERARREIDQVDSVVRQLDELREAAGLSKAELARRIGRDPSSIRRLFTAQANPELLLVASIAEDLGAEVRVVPRSSARRRKTAA
jgi:ribosome-binding protein aMBF1 (putative translation factor)